MLVANLKLAMGDRIRGNGWMSPETRKPHSRSWRRMDVMVGYPDKWRDYGPLEIAAGDLYGNVERANKFDARLPDKLLSASRSTASCGS